MEQLLHEYNGTYYIKDMKGLFHNSAILCTITALLALSGCQGDPASHIEGSYSLDAQSVQVNGIIINLGDWPGASVSISRIDGDNANVTIDSLLPGYNSLSAICSINENGKDKYSFAGSHTGDGRQTDIEGNVNKGRMTLIITDIVTSPVSGRWALAANNGNKADIKISFSNPQFPDITFGDNIIPVDSVVNLLNSAIGTIASIKLTGLRYIELDKTGYINIAWNGYVDDRVAPLLNNVIQYYPEETGSILHMYLRRTLTDGMGLPVSPLDFPVSYSLSGNRMTLSTDQDSLGPWMDMLGNAIAGYSYQDYIDDGSPLGLVAEDKFQEYKSLIVLFNGILAMPSTKYGIEVTMERMK